MSGFDLDAFASQFEEEFEEEIEEIEEESTEEESTEEDSTEEATPVLQTAEANARFAEMRRQLEEKNKYAGLVQKIAEKNGMTPEQVLEAYEQQELALQAQQQNVPVEVLQKINALEAENQNTKIAMARERFNTQVLATQEKYKLTNEEIRDTIISAQKDGIDLTSMPFERVYQIVNFDKILEKQVETARQKDLEAKKKREQESTIPVGSGNSVISDDATIEAEVLAYLKGEGAI